MRPAPDGYCELFRVDFCTTKRYFSCKNSAQAGKEIESMASNVTVRSNMLSVSLCAQARNSFAGFFGFVYFYFYFFYQTKLGSLTRPAAC